MASSCPVRMARPARRATWINGVSNGVYTASVTQLSPAIARSGMGMPGYACMPTGVALAMPSAPLNAASASGRTAISTSGYLSASERASAAARALSRSTMRSSSTSSASRPYAMARPTPPGLAVGKYMLPRRQKPRMIGVVADQSTVAHHHGVHRAHRARGALHRVEELHHRFLEGMRDVDAGKAEKPDPVEDARQIPSREAEHVRIDQVIPHVDAGGAPRRLLHGRRERPRDPGPDQAEKGASIGHSRQEQGGMSTATGC